MVAAAVPLYKSLVSRILYWFLIISSLFTVARPQNVVLIVQTATPQTVTIAYQNNTGKVIAPEQRWLLERQTDAGWEALPFAEDYPGWPEIAESCPPTRGGARTVNAEECFGRPLDPGVYRFTFYYVCEAVANAVGGEPQSVSVEFEL